MEYARWLEDDTKHMTELQAVLQPQIIDANLGAIVEECMRHYDELFHLRAMLARSDVFHLMTGLWATTAERCFLWMGGFRPSEILKVGVKLMQKHPFLSLCFFREKHPLFLQTNR
jgi:transcription factor TGA